MVSLDATAVDTPVAHELLDTYFRMRAETFPGHSYTTVFPDRALFTPPAGVFLVVRDEEGNRVGCGGVRAAGVGSHGTRYEIKHLYLSPETRGKGWGRMLMEGLAAHARDFGAHELVLDTHHTLEAAGRLYAAAGFTQIEPYNDNPNATRWYSKVLD